MDKIISLCKRRGFITPACEIYGGFASAYSYGPYGAELKNNIKKLWWDKFVRQRQDIVGMDGPVLLHPKLWKASGHTEGFNDALVDCKGCKKRYRADHLIAEAMDKDMEGDLEGMTKIFQGGEVKCPQCGGKDWTEVRNINMMFKTQMNGFGGDIYLRPETAGAIFVEFKNIVDSMRIKIPFGVAQIGKAFRNEIITGNFIFRIREFEMMEIEYFIAPDADWEKIFKEWLKLQEEFTCQLGVSKKDMRHCEHPKEKLAHYSKKTIDIEYKFPFGFGELYGLAYRTDFDLSQHSKFSNEKLEYFDAVKKKRFIPHVIEPTFGADRSVLAALSAAYHEEKIKDDIRVVLKLPSYLAPVQVAVFPLLKNKPKLVKKAEEIYKALAPDFACEFDDNGNIGKRYRRQDEIGTPYCVTVDFDSLKKNDVTIRERDSMKQKRVKVGELKEYFSLSFPPLGHELEAAWRRRESSKK